MLLAGVDDLAAERRRHRRSTPLFSMADLLTVAARVHRFASQNVIPRTVASDAARPARVSSSRRN
jgi:hypothetical protein